MSDDLVYQSFEIAAEQAGDITGSVYEKYFAACPGSEDLMAHIDEIVRGKMMSEVFRLLMVEDYLDEAVYLTWEVKNHEFAYSVEPQMYGNLFSAVLETMEESLGDAWNLEYEQAWIARIEKMTQEILPRFSQLVREDPKPPG